MSKTKLYFLVARSSKKKHLITVSNDFTAIKQAQRQLILNKNALTCRKSSLEQWTSLHTMATFGAIEKISCAEGAKSFKALKENPEYLKVVNSRKIAFDKRQIALTKFKQDLEKQFPVAFLDEALELSLFEEDAMFEIYSKHVLDI